jgi:hypothetical protein
MFIQWARWFLVAFIIIILLLPGSLRSESYTPIGLLILMILIGSFLESPWIVYAFLDALVIPYILISNLILVIKPNRNIQIIYRISIPLLLIWSWCQLVLTIPVINLLLALAQPIIISIAMIVEISIVLIERQGKRAG